VYGGRPGKPLDVNTCYRTVTLPWSDGDGTTWQVTVHTMRDERLAPIYEHWRWAEMYQAAHRVRPILHGRRIVITCAIPLSGLEATSISYTGRSTNTLDALRATARRLLREKGEFTRQDLARAAGMSESTVSRHWDDLVRAERLDIVEVARASARYPGGRRVQAATISHLQIL
jgi:DNA-binding transcriptional ArsR family regulator